MLAVLVVVLAGVWLVTGDGGWLLLAPVVLVVLVVSVRHDESRK